MKTIEQLRKELTEHGLTEYFDALAPLARNAVQITLDVQDDEDLAARNFEKTWLILQYG